MEMLTHAGQSITFNMFRTLRPCDLTFDLLPQNHITLIVGYFKVLPYTKFEDFAIIRF